MAHDSYYQYFFIHNTFGHFYYDTLNYFGNYLYPRFEHKIVGTFDKAVEYITKTDELGREVDKPNLPALVLNPTGDFGLAEAIAGGKQLHRFPNLSPELNLKLYEPIYQDSNIIIAPSFVRVKGEFELYLLLNSFYEYCDLRMYLLQMFGGLERYIYPFYFNSFLVLPDEILDYEYNNDITGENYSIDWSQLSSNVLVRTINQNKTVIPLQIKPIFRMISMNDNSNKPGGTDKLSEWRLNVNVEFEVEIPWFLIMQTDYLAENLDMSIELDTTFSSSRDYTVTPPINIEISSYHRDVDIQPGIDNPLEPRDPTLEEINDPQFNLLMTEANEYLDQKERDKKLAEGIDKDKSRFPSSPIHPATVVEDGAIQINTQVSQKSLVLNKRLFYYYTENDYNQTQGNIIIPITHEVTNQDRIVLYAENIKLAIGENYVIDLINNSIILKVETLPYRIYEDDILDIYIYSPQLGA